MPSKISVALTGVRDMIPLTVGTAPFAIIFGTLAANAGLPPVAVIIMSVLVFAGSAQFISINLIGSGASLPVIWLTTFVLNLRHALYSATLQPVVQTWPLRRRALVAFCLTDEIFAVIEQRLQNIGTRDVWPYFLGSALFFYFNWIGWSAVGALLGHRIPGVAGLGLDFAMIATFSAMVAPQLKTPPTVTAALTSALVACLAQGLPYKLGLLLAAVAGVSAGLTADFYARQQALKKECA